MNAPEQTRTLQDIAQPPARGSSLPADVQMGFGNLQSFELMQRAAKLLASSTLVPAAYRSVTEIKEYGKVTGYQENPNGLPNCVVALNMAQRMGADPLMVMQNLYIVEGRPSWSSQFIIAAINSCGRYSPLRFELTEASEPTEVVYNATEWQDQPNGGKAKKVTVQKKVTVRHQSCIAWAIEKETGERLESPRISIQMAIDEGWLTKNGSKWQTMPELMLRYRTAAFFGKLYAPELLMGLQTAEETHDIIDVELQPDGKLAATVESLRKEAPATSSTPRRATPDAVDVEDVASKNAEDIPLGAAKAQAGGIPAQGAAAESAPASQGDGEMVMTYEEVADAIQKANDEDVLAVAIDLIKAVPDEDQRKELVDLAQQRLEQINNPPATRAPRTARNAGKSVE